MFVESVGTLRCTNFLISLCATRQNNVKFHAMVQLLNKSERFELFDSTFGNELRPRKLLFNVAKFVLGCKCTDDNARAFLRMQVPKNVK